MLWNRYISGVVSACCAAVFAAGASAQTNITQWNFNNTTQSSTNPPASSGIGTASLFGGVTGAYANGAGNGGSSDLSVPNNAWNTTTYAPQGTDNGVRGVQFNVSTVGYDNVKVTYDVRVSNSCSRYVEVLYTINGSTFVQLSPRKIFIGGDGTFGDTWINGREVDFSGIPLVSNNPNFAFRIVPIFNPNPWTLQVSPFTPYAANTAYQPTSDNSPYGTGGSGGGTLRYDMVTVAGDPRPFAPIATAVTVSPTFGCSGDATTITINALVQPGQNPISTGVNVNANLSSVGGAAQAALTTSDGVNYSLTHVVPANLAVGTYNVVVTTTDNQNRTSSTTRSINLVNCTADSGSSVVISQVYGGGASVGPPAGLYNADFVEIFNRSGSNVNLDGWTVQYIDASNPAGFDDATNIVPLSGIIKPGQYKLIRFSLPGTVGQPLPTPDFIRSSPSGGLSSSAGRVALVQGTTLIGFNCFSNGANVTKDFLGYGATAICFEGAGATADLTTDTAAIRKLGGFRDSNQNFADFEIGTPTPRNRASGGQLAGFASGNASSICIGATYTLTVQVSPATSPASTGVNVTADLSSIGGSASAALTNNGDGTWSISLPVNATEGAKSIVVTTSDAQLRSDAATVLLNVGDCTSSTANVVISKVYGGGQSTGGTINADFVELKNRTDCAVDLAGWSIQYGSNNGVNGLVSKADLAGTIPAQGYFLIRMSAESNGVPLLTPPDFVAVPNISMDNSSGRVLLSRGTTVIGNNTSSTDVADWVGYGSAITFEGVVAAPRLSSTSFLQRAGDGCQDTNQNWNDFIAVDALTFPNNSSSTPVACSGVPCPVVTLGCSPADIAYGDGEPLPPIGQQGGFNPEGPDGGDFDCFFNFYFAAAPDNAVCDIAYGDGEPLPPYGVPGGFNPGVDGGDFDCFFNYYFNGCL